MGREWQRKPTTTDVDTIQEESPNKLSRMMNNVKDLPQ
jgi:hypothetical protein